MTAKQKSLIFLLLAAVLTMGIAGMGSGKGSGLTVYAAQMNTSVRSDLNMPTAGEEALIARMFPEPEHMPDVNRAEVVAELTGAQPAETMAVFVGGLELRSDAGEEEEEEETAETAEEEEPVEEKAPETLEELAVLFAEDYVVVNGEKVTSSLNIRRQPQLDAEVVGKFYPGAGGELHLERNGWYYIVSGNVNGWVNGDYVLTGEEEAAFLTEEECLTATVTAEALNVRAEASLESDVMHSVHEGDVLTVLDLEGEWLSVRLENGSEGYVNAGFVEIGTSLKTAMTLEEEKDYLAELARIAEEQRRAEEARRIEAERQARIAMANAQIAASTNPQIVLSHSPLALSESDIRMIACICNAEAGCESYNGKLAVANVILNRYRSGAYGSITGVLFAPGQFDTAGLDRLNYYLSVEPSGECYQAARDAVAGYNNIGGHMFFCSRKSFNPARYSSYIWVDNQCFYSR